MYFGMLVGMWFYVDGVVKMVDDDDDVFGCVCEFV